MVPRLSLAALLVLLQNDAVSAAFLRRHREGDWDARDSADEDSQVVTELRDSMLKDQSSSFLERNLPWLATLPYIEGSMVSLARRMDLSVLFSDQAADSFSAITPEIEETGKKIDMAGKQFADEFHPDTVKAKNDKFVGDLHPDKLAKDMHPDKLHPDALARDIPEKFGEHHPILDKDGKPKDDNTVLTALISTSSSILVWLIFVLAAAVIYRQTKDVSVVDMEAAKGKFKDQPFAHGPFSCFEDMDVCCWSSFCGAVQWADTMSAVGSLSFWLGFTLFMVLASVNMLTGILVWALVALVFTYFRQDLRRKFELENETSDMVKDFAMWCCCSCCAIVQEARQIKEVRQLAA